MTCKDLNPLQINDTLFLVQQNCIFYMSISSNILDPLTLAHCLYRCRLAVQLNDYLVVVYSMKFESDLACMHLKLSTSHLLSPASTKVKPIWNHLDLTENKGRREMMHSLITKL